MSCMHSHKRGPFTRETASSAMNSELELELLLFRFLAARGCGWCRLPKAPLEACTPSFSSKTAAHSPPCPRGPPFVGRRGCTLSLLADVCGWIWEEEADGKLFSRANWEEEVGTFSLEGQDLGEAHADGQRLHLLCLGILQL